MADNYKNIEAPLRSGELARPIQIKNNNLAGMIAKGAAYVEQVALSSPVQIDRLFGVKTGVEAALALEAASTAARTMAAQRHAPTAKTMFARGALAIDQVHGCKVTVIKANVGVTKKGRPIHRVANSRGETWLQSERKLKRV